MKKNIIIFLLASLSIFQYFSGKESEGIHTNNINAISEQLKFYKTKNNELVASKQAVMVNNKVLKQLNDSILEVSKNFKKPDVIVKYKWKVKTDTIVVPIEKKIYVNNGSSVPFEHNDKWIGLSGMINDSSIIFNPPNITNEQLIVSGFKKQGIFKPKQYYVDIKNTNPYINSQSVTTFKVNVKRSPLEKWWITIPVGVAAGAIISN